MYERKKTFVNEKPIKQNTSKINVDKSINKTPTKKTHFLHAAQSFYTPVAAITRVILSSLLVLFSTQKNPNFFFSQNKQKIGSQKYRKKNHRQIFRCFSVVFLVLVECTFIYFSVDNREKN
jgi:hypothetical protein